MKEITCEIIRDILPLYVDEAVSEDTKDLVEEHLFTCEACREEAELMKKTMVLPVHKDVRTLDKEMLKKWSHKWLTRKVLIAAVSVLATLGAAAGIYSALVLPELFIPYDEQKFQILEENGKLYAEYLGDCYDSPWSRYLEPKMISEKKKTEMDRRWFLGDADKVEQVYYGEFDLEYKSIKEKPFHEQVSDCLEDMELIYETK